MSGKSIRSILIVFCLCLGLNLYGCSVDPELYSQEENWAYLETEVSDPKADVFFLCPSVYSGDEDSYNMSLRDKETKASFVGAINMEKGIYDDEDARFFAPYYQQIGLNVYEMTPQERESYLEIAYNDVREAFLYYLEHYNEGNPIVLAGFSQGADMCLRLLKDVFEDDSLQERLVACYAIGWQISDEELKNYPQLKMAQNETDTGVIVSFNSETEFVEDSLMIPEGTSSHAINPLNWKTDGTLADKSLNQGACFTDYEGNITQEIPQFTGAYIDEERGALTKI
ncbi:MAG TPA: DUF3089 domain-containing protein [Candidatus Faecalicoccus intestinipullorum]|nr:DUF3089 domain-containing protein [Candidatus Faecalicoccus intestinipullorum]